METEDSASAPVDPRCGRPRRRVRNSTPDRTAGSARGRSSSSGCCSPHVGFVLTSRTAPCADFHQGTQFSGSDARLAKWIGSCGNDLGEARATLLADGVLIAGYAIAAGGILRRWWPLYQAPGLKRRERLVVALPFVTAAIDLLENIVTGSALGANDTRFTYPDNLVAPTLVSTLAWLKMLAYGLGLLCVAAVCLLAFARRKESAMPTPRPDQPIAMHELVPPTDLGVCCSGGGIRAAAFALGALDQLERAGIMDRARWLAAVSGGNYAATSWTLARVNDHSGHAAADVIDWLNEPIPYSKTPQHRFLRNGPGGLGRSMIAALVYVAFNVAVLGALVAAVAWPIGRLIGSPAIQPKFHVFGALPPSLDDPARAVAPCRSPARSCRNPPARLGAAVVADVVAVAPCRRPGGDRRRRRSAHRRDPVGDGVRRQLGAPRRPRLPGGDDGSGGALRCPRRRVAAGPQAGAQPVLPQAAVPRRCVARDRRRSCGPARWRPTRPPVSDCSRR